MLPKEKTRQPQAVSKSDQQQALELYRRVERSRLKLLGSDGRTEDL